MNPIKVLSIGHSYSLNSCEYICKLAASQGVHLLVGVAYKGNCSLEQHYNFLKERAIYGDAIGGWYQKYFPNGNTEQYIDKYTLEDIVKDEEWDYIIFQQNINHAGNWGIIEEWFPKLWTEVKKLVASYQKKAVQYLYNQIWGMEAENYNPASIPLDVYNEYNHDAITMYKMVSKASKKAAQVFDMRLIPTGEAFQNAREQDLFNADKGGHILVSDDSNHANSYGKYLAGATWLETIAKVKVDKKTAYYPEDFKKEEAETLIDCATQAVDDTDSELQQWRV